MDLSLNLIPFGYTNITHVVAESSYFNIEAFVIRNRYVHPIRNLLLNFSTFPVTYNDFILFFQSSIDEAVFAIAVSSLVQVHEVHINRCPRNAFIVLSCEVKQWFLQQFCTANPHFCRGERMHPSDNARYFITVVHFFHNVGNFIGTNSQVLQDNWIREHTAII
ncbi:hypothetical protein D3C84_950400 [compost metagenome]